MPKRETPILDISADLLRDLAGARSWARGQAYFEDGSVVELLEDKQRSAVVAQVVGTRKYTVELWMAGGELGWECTCPMGDQGSFCKHCVAAGLAYLADEPTAEEDGKTAGAKAGGRQPRGGGVTLDDVRDYLARQDVPELVDIIMEQLKRDDVLRRDLLTRVAARGPEGLDIGAFEEAIDSAVDTYDFVDYRSARDFGAGIEAVVDSIERLLDDDHGAAIVEVIEYAIERVEDAMERVDDSDGCVGGSLDRLGELHHRACVAAQPDPEALGERLFELELTGSWDTFHNTAEGYADVLGQRGLAAFRRLAEAEWAKVPPPGSGEAERAYGSSRRRVTRIMESLARVDGNLDELVEIKSRDLSSPYAYLQIAELYLKARKRDQALEWAERGVEAFPDKRDPRLREFLADQYHSRKRHDEAMALIWASFAGSRSLNEYEALKKHATRAGQWPAWREKAIALLRECAAREARRARETRTPWGFPAAPSTLVGVLLSEKDVEGAWQAAQEHGCTSNLWLEVADRRAKDHPADSLPIYQKHAETLIAQKNNDAYREAVRLIRRARQCMERLGKEGEFGKYIEAVRASHRRKRNLMALLRSL